MKSLEIVRESISKIKNKIEKLIPTKSCNNTLPIERVVKSLRKNLENQIIIEKDLEVLEIIRNKKVDLQIFYAVIKSSYPYEEQIRQYNHYFSKCYHLTQEEFDKLKQWLEVNE